MIVSNTHNFIFLKVSKTGGSSVEAYLRRFCGPGDIVTWLDDDEEEAIKGTGACPPMGFNKPAAGVPLLLAGGSQMAAVLALALALSAPAARPQLLDQAAIATTATTTTSLVNSARP